MLRANTAQERFGDRLFHDLQPKPCRSLEMGGIAYPDRENTPRLRVSADPGPAHPQREGPEASNFHAQAIDHGSGDRVDDFIDRYTDIDHLKSWKAPREALDQRGACQFMPVHSTLLQLTKI
jgi:hypothetical protein